MKLSRLSLFLLLPALASRLWAQAAAPAAPGMAVQSAGSVSVDLLERFVGWLHGFFPSIDDGMFHWVACAIVVLLAVVLRHIVTNIIFHFLKKLAAKTETTLDDKLFPALEEPVATFVMVAGIFAALTVLQLSERMDRWVSNGAQISLLTVVLWGLIRAGGAVLDHLEELAHGRQMTVATFMPLIKKTLLVFAVIFGILVIAQSLGWPVQSFLAGLGIGGLAFALAAQDTIANLFGSFVVVMDQPFKVGDLVQIGANTGTVEDIGLRSTKMRTAARTLIVIPNKSVAAEAIVNFSRMPQRRVEQTLGLSCATPAEQVQGFLGDLRALLGAEAGVQPGSFTVNFVNFGESTLDVQLVYFATDPDWSRHLELRERINLKVMQAAAARGIAFAFPTRTIELSGEIARRLAAK